MRVHVPQAPRGFTLIELLVAITILAVVAVLGWRGLDSIVRSRVALTQELEQTRGIQLAFAQMQSDCAQVVQPDDVGGRPALVVEAERITLIRSVRTENQPLRVQVVSYRLREGTLMRAESAATRELAELDAMWQAMREEGGAGAATGVALRADIAGMRVQSWFTAQPGWRDPAAPSANVEDAANAANDASFAEQGVMPSGLQVQLQLRDQTDGSGMTKIFLVGAV